MGRTFKTSPRAALRFALVATFCISLTSCLPTGNDCATDFDVAVKPDDIQGSSKILISLAKLAFLEQGSFVLEDVELETGVKGAHSNSEDIALDMNGIKMSRKDGKPMCDQMDREGGDSRGRFKIHKMYLNGGLSFELFLLQLKFQRGQLAMTVKGKNVALKDAVVHFRGKTYGKCPTNPQPPPPQPKPVAKTKIDSVTPATSPTASDGATIAFSADQTGVTFWCSLDGAVATKCASPQTYAGLASGAHVFKVYSQNSSGVVENPPVQYAWTVDRVAPTVTITNAGSLPTLTNQSAIGFTFAMSEAGRFECSLDDATFAACESPLALNGLKEGPHRFAVRAIDGLGNVSGQPATFDWNVDQTAPITTIVSMTPAEGIGNATERAFEFGANESANFECAVDNGAFTACASPVALSGLTDGPHYFEVRAVDLAGNRGVSSSAAWKVDTVAPQLALGTVAPAVGSLSRADKIAVEVSADEIATLYCAFDGAVPAACVSPLEFANLADGVHGLSIHAVDTAGNTSAPLDLSWTLDRRAPTLNFAEILPSPAGQLNVRDVSFRVAVSENASLAYTLNGQTIPFANPLALMGLGDGPYRLEVTATDVAGNVSGQLVHEFSIDTAAPGVSVTATDGRNPTNADRREFVLAANEDVTFACDVDLAGFAACASPFTLSGLADGEHVMVVRATDVAGNSSVVSTSWMVDTRPPVTQISADVQGSAATLTFTADETATFSCAIDGGAETVCASPLQLAGLAAGAHTVVVHATDAAGNRDLAGATVEFSVRSPIVTSITAANPGAGSLTSQNSASFSFTADQAASGFECSLDGAPFAACASPATYASLGDGAHAFRVRAIDAYGVRDPNGASSAWTVDQTAPVVGNLSASATTNSITVTWTTDEPATDQVRYGVGFTVTSSTAEGQAYGTSHSVRLVGLSSNTTYTVQVFGRDRAGNTYLSATRTVKTSR